MQITGVLATDAGLFGLWAPAAFRGVVDYDDWEEELLEDDDIARHVVAGAFVPVNIGGDGAFQFLVRVGSAADPAELTARERPYRLVASEPYLLVTADGAVLSGIEHVGADTAVGLPVPLPAGRWQVTVVLLDWKAEPGQPGSDGRPTPAALPDFVLLLNPEPDAPTRFRTSIETFERPTGP